MTRKCSTGNFLNSNLPARAQRPTANSNRTSDIVSRLYSCVTQACSVVLGGTTDCAPR